MGCMTGQVNVTFFEARRSARRYVKPIYHMLDRVLEHAHPNEFFKSF